MTVSLAGAVWMFCVCGRAGPGAGFRHLACSHRPVLADGRRDAVLRSWSVIGSGRKKSEEEGIHLGGGRLSGGGRAPDGGEITVEGIAGIVGREI